MVRAARVRAPAALASQVGSPSDDERCVKNLVLPLVGLLLAALGARVLWRARRHSSVPELGVGVWFAGIGIGTPIMHRASIPGGVAPELAPVLIGLGQGLIALAFCGLFVFTWRTFGSDSGWRRNLARAGICACLATWAGVGWFEGFAPGAGPATLVLAGVRAVAVAWAFVETTQYAVRMRRRARIGLADPVVANRFVLWSVWTGSLLLGMGVAIGVRWTQIELGSGRVVDVDALVSMTRVVFALFGLAASSAMWLSFFPPVRYQAWLRAESAGA